MKSNNNTIELPKLTYTNKGLYQLILILIKPNSIIITDNYNFKALYKFGNNILVNRCDKKTIDNIKYNYNYSRIISIGGCTVLDVGRACADEAELICLPTILSTTCISNDLSNIYFENKNSLIRTNIPKEVIISPPILLNSSPKEIIKWTQSGFGDLFSNISASIDLQFRRNKLNIKGVKENVPEIFDALDWVANCFKDYDENTMIVLSKYLHNASIDVTIRGNTELTSGGEHILYNKIFENYSPNKIKATHGQIVAIGTLINVKIFCEYIENNELYNKFTRVYKKLRLPIYYNDLYNIGIDKSFLIKYLMSILNNNTILGYYFSLNNFDILDRIF